MIKHLGLYWLYLKWRWYWSRTSADRWLDQQRIHRED